MRGLPTLLGRFNCFPAFSWYFLFRGRFPRRSGVCTRLSLPRVLNTPYWQGAGPQLGCASGAASVNPKSPSGTGDYGRLSEVKRAYQRRKSMSIINCDKRFLQRHIGGKHCHRHVTLTCDKCLLGECLSSASECVETPATTDLRSAQSKPNHA